MKRFYREARLAAADRGFVVTLDHKPVRTPARSELVVPYISLGEAIAAEWAGQGETVEPATLQLTRLANTAIDLVALKRDQVADEVAGYGATDLLCYRADGPEDLAQRQDEAWRPLLDWLEARYGVSLAVTRSIRPQTQKPEALDAIRTAVEAYGDFPLAGLHAATAATGSVVIGLAVGEGCLSGAAAFDASQLDETYQIEQWGEDAEATKRRDGLRRDIVAAARFLDLCRDAA